MRLQRDRAHKTPDALRSDSLSALVCSASKSLKTGGLHATCTIGQYARLLERLLDLIAGRAGVPGSDLGTQLGAQLATSDLLDQRPGRLAAGPVSVSRRHYPYRGRSRKTGPPLVTRICIRPDHADDRLPAQSLRTQVVEPSASHVAAIQRWLPELRRRCLAVEIRGQTKRRRTRPRGPRKDTYGAALAAPPPAVNRDSQRLAVALREHEPTHRPGGYTPRTLTNQAPCVNLRDGHLPEPLVARVPKLARY